MTHLKVIQRYALMGCTVAQANMRRPLSAGFVENKVALMPAPLRGLCFSLPLSFHQQSLFIHPSDADTT